MLQYFIRFMLKINSDDFFLTLIKESEEEAACRTATSEDIDAERREATTTLVLSSRPSETDEKNVRRLNGHIQQN